MPLTLAMLLAHEWVTPWKPSGDRMMKRGFYRSHHWSAARNGLPGRVGALGDDPAAPAIDLVAMDLSIRGRLDGLVETFVTGWPRIKLIRPLGYGMEPPFKRMRPPNQVVIEMCTEHTRTFGFFVGKDQFIAWTLDLADLTHEHPERYTAHAASVMKVIARMSPSCVDATTDVEDLIGDDPDE